jgi:hypothetical protein
MSQTVNLDPLVCAYLKRIADALDRAYPKPESDGKLKLGVANYNYDSEQTTLLKELAKKAQDPSSHGPKE